MKKPPSVHPWHPAPYDDADTYAMTRIAVEIASNSQYRIADHKTTNKRQKPTLTKFGIAGREGTFCLFAQKRE